MLDHSTAAPDSMSGRGNEVVPATSHELGAPSRELGQDKANLCLRQLSNMLGRGEDVLDVVRELQGRLTGQPALVDLSREMILNAVAECMELAGDSAERESVAALAQRLEREPQLV